jgi:RNA polymerase sigma-70 factor (ECF subfamily)
MELTMTCGGEAGSPLADRWGALIEAARRGDPEALGRALEPFRDYLLLVANQEIEPELRAKLGGSDLVQDTFLGAQRDLASFRGRSEIEWRLWLRGILVHLLANHRRHYRSTSKRRVDREVSLATTPRCDWPACNPSPSTNLAAQEAEAALRSAMDCLAEHHRNVVLWHHRDRLPFEEVGRRLGVSADAARKHWERALKALRKELKASHGPS